MSQFNDVRLSLLCFEALFVCGMGCPQIIGFAGVLIYSSSNSIPVLTDHLHAAATPDDLQSNVQSHVQLGHRQAQL